MAEQPLKMIFYNLETNILRSRQNLQQKFFHLFAILGR